MNKHHKQKHYKMSELKSKFLFLTRQCVFCVERKSWKKIKKIAFDILLMCAFDKNEKFGLCKAKERGISPSEIKMMTVMGHT